MKKKEKVKQNESPLKNIIEEIAQNPHLLVSAPRDPNNNLKENFLNNYREVFAKSFFDYLVTKKLGGDPNKKDENGMTPLYHAALSNDVELAKLLIEAGAKVDILDKYGRTEIEVAEKKGNTAVATYLKKHQINI